MRLETWSSTRKTLGRPGSPSTSRIEGTPIGPYDVLIAGQAKARKLTLVTHNTTEFQRVPGLKVEDWRGAIVVTVSGVPASEVAGQASLRVTSVRLFPKTRND
jgi:hypothetical protein